MSRINLGTNVLAQLHVAWRVVVTGLVAATISLSINAAPADQNFNAQSVGSKGSNSVTIDGVIYSNNDIVNIQIVNDGDIATGADFALGFRSSGPNTSTVVGFKTSDGSEFKLNSFVVSTGLGGTTNLTIKGYRDTVEVVSTNYNLDGIFFGTFIAPANWEYIDEVRILGSDLDIDIDDIDFSPAVVPDTTPPTVSSVSSSTANGVYKAGDVISIQVNFTEIVNVISTPQLTLETGATDRTINYASGSGSTALTFNYTVQAGDSTSDLDYTGTGALNTNGGSIRDGAGNNATLTLALPGAANSLGANKNIVIDGVAPTVTFVSGSTANGIYRLGDVISIQVYFSEVVTVTGTPQLTLETGATDRIINYVSGSGTSTLTFSYTIQAGDNSSDLDYAGTSSLGLNGGTIRDAAGNNATLTLAIPGAANSLGANKNLVIDGVMPTVVSTAPSGGAVSTDTSVDFIVNFSESVSNISTDDFALGTTGGATGTIASVSASSGSSVTVTVSGIAGSGTIKLNVNASTNISDAAGNSGPAAFTSGTAHAVAIPTAPSAPTIGTATAGDGQASVTFTAPVSNGGSAITTYTATANPGGAFGTCAGPAACTASVTGLTNGTAYTFTVTATNSIGTGPSSGVSNSVTPKGSQTISFANPGARNFGTTPTLTATAASATGTNGLTVSFTSSTTGVCTITSGGALTFVTAGSCTINADQAGDAATSAAPTVAQTFTVNATVPGAPTIGTATAGNTQATVTFTPPASTGGAAILAGGYTATANPGGATGTGSGSPITVTGLTNGVAYTFTVTAANSAGTGAASAASNAVTPAAPQTITFNNPGAQSFGTSPTLTATSTSGLTVTFSSSTTGVCTVTSGGVLTFNAAGTCTINADQPGNTSYLPAPQVSRSFTVSPVVPGAPTIGTAIAGDTQASVAFTAPTSIGGSAITGYVVTVSPADVVPVIGASSPIVVTGLTNGQGYTFTVTAENVAGTGPASAASNSITPAATQTITFANPGAQNFGTTPTLAATADSGLTVVFTSSTAGVCTITTGGALAFVTAGTCTINADQPGNASYLAATQVTRSFAVNPVPSVTGTVPGMAGVATATLTGGGATCTLDPANTRFMAAVSLPAGRTAPNGGFEFRAAGCTGSVTVTLVYPDPLPAGVAFWKFGPATPAAASSWFQWTGASLSGDRRTVSYTIADNGVGDSDPAIGVLRDPFVPALGGAADAVGIPVDAPWALALISALIGWLGWRRSGRAAPAAQG